MPRHSHPPIANAAPPRPAASRRTLLMALGGSMLLALVPTPLFADDPAGPRVQFRGVDDEQATSGQLLSIDSAQFRFRSQNGDERTLSRADFWWLTLTENDAADRNIAPTAAEPSRCC
ncbi:MAG: hypothetical protein R3B90_20150 [Planctomycetaceae bacterium]